MLTPETAVERMFCPTCGRPGAYDCTGEDDWVCVSHGTPGGCEAFISPLRERDLQGKELIRLRLENEQLRAAIAQLQSAPVIWYDTNRLTPEQVDRLRAGDVAVRAELPPDAWGPCKPR